MTATWVSLAGAAVIVLLSLMRRSTPLSEAAATPATAILPQTRTERLAWLLVISPTAAVCEEVIYRGFLLTLLRTALGLPAALLSQAFLFAFHHGAHRQGAALFLLRGAIGIGFGVLVSWRGNLLAAMAIHYLIDAAFALAPIQISSQQTSAPAMRT
jgi:membrane protease YdiL (CAAX protease family)